eukprot:10366357-Alexandrium_andersonii.AAC.1
MQGQAARGTAPERAPPSADDARADAAGVVVLDADLHRLRQARRKLAQRPLRPRRVAGHGADVRRELRREGVP